MTNNCIEVRIHEIFLALKPQITGFINLDVFCNS